MAAKKRKGPAQPIMRECDHCGGDGEVQVSCDDCGNELDEDSVADDSPSLNPDCDDLCKECLENRREDAAAAEDVAAIPLNAEPYHLDNVKKEDA